MSEAPKPPPAAGAEDKALPDLELVRRAGFDPDHFLSLPEVEQRMVLKMAERLVDAARRAEG
ncbi:MAG TPA: hypothetical protein VLV50_09650 [Stellaceae bacterium]|nr:hypothetical protein [Stellaceae bacterium]